MTRHLAIILLFFIIACNPDEKKDSYTLPDAKAINDIVETIIFDKNLPVIKNQSKADTSELSNGRKITPYIIPLSTELRKIKIVIPNRTESGIPIPLYYNSVYINELLRKKINDVHFFNHSDSLYFLFQNEALKQFEISKSISGRLVTTTMAKQNNKGSKRMHTEFYDLTIPIFSEDKTKAYVEVTHNCTGLCGSATAVYLEKKNEKWTIAGSYILWIS